jgi:hypothetical protein
LSIRIKCEHGHYLSKDTEDYRFPEFDALLIGDNKPPFWRRLIPEGCKLHLQQGVKLKSVISTNTEKNRHARY